LFVYYESIKRELQRRLTYEYRCDERLKTKNEESTLLVDTGLVVELEHLKTKTRLIDEKFVSVRGECETSMRLATRLESIVVLEKRLGRWFQLSRTRELKVKLCFLEFIMNR
jgi:hypothetical protein